MSKYVEGEVLGTNEVQELPIGSVVRVAKPGNSNVVGEFVRVRRADGTWIKAEDGQPVAWGTTSVYIVVFIPPVPLVEDPVMKLVAEIEHHITPAVRDGSNPLPKIAEFILTEFVRKGEQPSEVIDDDGDVWVLREDGLYDPPQDESHLSPKNVDEIRRDYGIKKVIV
jgi:hypothetical protein